MSLLSELSQKWNLPLNEVKKIQSFMNEYYYLSVIQSKEDEKFYGVLFEIHEKPSGSKFPLLIATLNKAFDTSDEAAQFLNTYADTWEMPEMRAYLMGVPKDAYRLLKKLPVKIKTHTQNKVIQSQHTKA